MRMIVGVMSSVTGGPKMLGSVAGSARGVAPNWNPLSAPMVMAVPASALLLRSAVT